MINLRRLPTELFLRFLPRFVVSHKREKRTVNNVVIYYRICDKGNPKDKPSYINKEVCLKNALHCFPMDKVEWHVLADNILDTTMDMLLSYLPASCIERATIGSNTKTFRKIYMDAISNHSDNDLIYFIEDDYLHVEGAFDCLISAAEHNYVDYYTLYDHPDKYGYDDVNPFVTRGGEKSYVYLCGNHYWKRTNATTMTFAAFVDTLKRDKSYFWKWTAGRIPNDFALYTELRFFGEKYLACPIPSLSSHCETKFLAPITDWEEISKL